MVIMSDTPSVKALRELFDKSNATSGAAAPSGAAQRRVRTEAPASILGTPTPVAETTHAAVLSESSSRTAPREAPSRPSAPQTQPDDTENHGGAEEKPRPAGETRAEEPPQADVVPDASAAAKEPAETEQLGDGAEPASTHSPVPQACTDQAPKEASTAPTDTKDAPPSAPVVPPRPTQTAAQTRPAPAPRVHDTSGYSMCFDAINVDGVVWPSTTQTIWRRSGMPDAELADIWNQVAPANCRGLSRDQFTKGMRLIDARLRVQQSVRKPPPRPPARP